jgi:drug/metabolite transporter (DMT)-like permease
MTVTAVAAQPRRSILGAIAWMIGALVSFSVVAIAGREAGRAMPTGEIMFWRGVLGIVILLGVAAIVGLGRNAFRTRQPSVTVFRSGVHFGAQWAWLHALTLIPLVELFALEFTAPLWVAVLAPVVLGERLTPARVAAAVLGFIGVLVVIRPGSIGLTFGTALALASALGFAINMMSTKVLTRTDGIFTILFWLNALQAIIGAGFVARGFTSADTVTWGWVALVGIGGLTAHYALTRAFALADAIVVAPMDFLRLPLIAAVGAFVYNETLTLWVALGAAIVVAANALNIVFDHKR